LAAYFKNADKVFMVAPPVTGNFTVPQGKTLAVVGDVDLTTPTVAINAFEGTIDVSEGKFINATDDTFLVKPDVAEAFAAAVPSGIVPEYLSSIPSPGSPTAITKDVILDSLAIGGTDNITAANFLTFAGSSDTVYVLGNAVIDAAAAVDLSAPKLVVYGEIQAKGTGTLTIGDDVEASLKATGALKLEGVSNLSELDTGTYTVTVTTEDTIELDTLNSASGGKLELLAVVTKVVIGEGNGNIEFNTGAPAFETAASSFGNTGTTTFKAAAEAAIGISFAGPVVFEGDLTLTAVPATFGKAAYFAAGKKILGTTNASVITLKPGASLGLPVASGTPSVFGAIIANSGATDVTLTPATNTTLTFATGRILTQAGSGAHSIAIGGTTPEASLVAGATYKVASETGKVGTLTIGNGGKLVLAAGVLSDAVDYNNLSAKLILTGGGTGVGALLTGTGTVAAGGTAIVPSTQGWQVVDTGGTGTVTIEADTITATANTVTLAGVASGSGTITVAKTKTLKIAANTAIDLTDSGSIVLAQGASSDGGIIDLSATTAKIAGLTGGGSDRNLVGSNITNGIFTPGTGTGKVQGGGTASAGNAYITGGNDTEPNPIQADDNGNVSIDKNTTVGA
jgi:hypothetical protein